MAPGKKSGKEGELESGCLKHNYLQRLLGASGLVKEAGDGTMIWRSGCVRSKEGCAGGFRMQQ